eukprot:1239511-Rhodomonas_salina.1
MVKWTSPVFKPWAGRMERVARTMGEAVVTGQGCLSWSADEGNLRGVQIMLQTGESKYEYDLRPLHPPPQRAGARHWPARLENLYQYTLLAPYGSTKSGDRRIFAFLWLFQYKFWASRIPARGSYAHGRLDDTDFVPAVLVVGLLGCRTEFRTKGSTLYRVQGGPARKPVP